MNKNPSFVEINGKTYDALTGRLIGAPAKMASHLKRQMPGLSIDGFKRPPIIGKIRPASASRHPKRAIHSAARGIQRSKTLMRSIVKKPGYVKDSVKRLAPKARLLGRDSVRDGRARQTPRDSRVRHFGLLAAVRARPIKPAKEGEVLQRRSKTSAMALSVPQPGVMSATSHQRLERLLDLALARADAHKQARARSRRGPARLFKSLPKWLNITIITLIVLGITGVIVWQKLPGASLKLASSVAHVKAVIPRYTPEGFAKSGPVKVEGGVVTITYKAMHDASKSYVVKERPSDQDSASAVADTASTSAQVQTTQNRGVPINIIKDGDKNKAVCTGGGRQTTLEDSANLPPSEINNILGDVC